MPPELPEARAVRLSPGIASAKQEEPKPEKPPAPDWSDDDAYDPTAWYDLSALGPLIMLILFVILPLCCSMRSASP